MGRISIQNVSKQFGTQIVLSNLSLELNSGEVTGLVGANGAGKTTIFRLIEGELEPDRGTVTRSKGMAIGYLRQEPDVGMDRTLHDEVGSVFAELMDIERQMHVLSEQMATLPDGPALASILDRYQRLDERFTTEDGYTVEARLGGILSGIGFSESDYSLPMSSLSGGQKCRAALAKLLLKQNDFLLLDEPTNHLDIDAVRWLELFLKGYRGGAVIISHDRYLLDRLADRIIEIERGRAYDYPGNYTNYVQAKQTRLLTLQRQYVKDKEYIEKERAFITKHLAGQRTKEAQGRRTRLERRIKAGEFVREPPALKREVKITFETSTPKGTTVLRADDLSKAYEEKILFSDLRLQVEAGQKIGITGPNGSGKTTLLKILMGEVQADAGEVRFDTKASIGYYAQEPTALNPDATVIEEIQSVRAQWSQQQTRDFLGAFNFRGDDVFKTLGIISGGEQSRVRLIKLILSSPDLLILDEPTNHLDIPSREALESALFDFPGTIIAVSHDRYFLDRLVDHLLVIKTDGHRMYAGNYSYYVEQVERDQRKRAKNNTKPTGKRTLPKATPTPRDSRIRESAKYDHCSVNDLEIMLMEREQELATLNEGFADPRTFKNPGARGRLEEQVDTLKHEMRIIEEAWSERIESE